MDKFTCDMNKILLTRLNIYTTSKNTHTYSLPRERELKQNTRNQEVIALFEVQ